ncbi:autotransporter domain-containing protein, partial [Martelella radicis]
VTISGGATLAGSGNDAIFTLGSLDLTNAVGMIGPSTIRAANLTAGAPSLFTTSALTAAGVVLVPGNPLTPGQDPYFLIDYTVITGAASDIKIDVNSTGIDVNTTNATVVSVGNRVAILVGSGNDVNTSAGVWWNGTTTAGSTIIGGGGTWTADQTAQNWTDSGGTSHVAWQQSKTAVFDGQGGGSVTVDSVTNGAIMAQGLDFRITDYVLFGASPNEITLESAFSDNLTRLNADPQVSATIAVNLTGAAGVKKTGGGTIFFTGDKDYQGGTSVVAGILQLGAGTATGSVTGGINVSTGGTLSLYAPQAGQGVDFSNTLSGVAGAALDISGVGIVNFNSQSAQTFLGTTTVLNGATLSGSGSLGGPVEVQATGAISGTHGTTLGLGSQLTFAAATTSMVVLLDGAAPNTMMPLFSTTGAFSAASGGVITVNTVGNLALPLSTSYALVSYVGADPNTDSFSFLRPNATYSLATRNSILYLDVGTPRDEYWNPDQNPPGQFGGDNTWTRTGGMVWSDQNGQSNGPWLSGAIAKFEDRQGAVRVDAMGGAIEVGGMEFDVGPYTLTGDALTLSSADGNAVKINVNENQAPVTIGVVLAEATAGTALEKDGPGTLELTAASTYTGMTTVSAGTLQLGVTGTPLQGPIAVASTLVVNTSGTVTFGTANVLTSIGGAARLNVTSGVLEFDSVSPGFFGRTTISRGATLTGTGHLGGSINVSGGATLEGPEPGSYFAAGDGILNVMDGATIAVKLSAAEAQPGTPAPISTDTLITGANPLMVTVRGGPSLPAGTYPLIDFSGGYTGNPSQIDASSVAIQSNVFRRVGTRGDVNSSGTLVLLAGPDAYQYWNGVNQQPLAPPSVAGGQGTWVADMTNWTNQGGDSSERWYNGGYAIFETVGGQVDVDSAPLTSGQIRVAVMDFEVDGYDLEPLNGNDTLVLTTLQGATSAEISVNQLNPGNPVTATIGVSMTSAGGVGLTKSGDGTLVLTADNSYQGATALEAGTLRVTAGSAVPGDISIGQAATWDWDVTTPQSFAGQISSIGMGGGGTFNFNAGTNGSLQLTAANTYTGVTNVNSGTLDVTGPSGSLHAATLLGSINVADGATLQGYGSFGNITVNSRGKLILGESAGAFPAVPVNAESLHIERDGRFMAFIDYNTGEYTQLVVSGEARIELGADGRSTKVTGAVPDNPPAFPIIVAGTLTYDGMSAPTGRSGYQFVFARDQVNPNILNFLAVPALLADMCAGLNPSACDVLGAVYGLGDGNGLFGDVMNSEKEELEGLLGQLSGDVYASSDAAMVAGSRYLRNATGSQVRGSLGGVSTGAGISAVSNYAAEPSPVATPFGAFEEDNGGIGVWTAGYGAWSSMDGGGMAAKMTDSVGGFFLGADAAAFGSMRFGAVAGFGQSTYKVDAHNAKGTSDDYTFGLYGGGEWGGFGVDFGTAYTWHSVSTNRNVFASTFNDHLSGSYDAGTFQVYGGLGYGFDVTDSFTLEPYVDAAYINQHSDAFSETGGLAALSYESQTMNTGFTTVGLRGAWAFDLGGYQNRLSASAGWRHGFGDLDPKAAFTFAGSDPFGVTGTPLAEDQAVLSIGWDTEFSDTVSVGVNYTGQFGGGNQSQNVTARLNIRF